MYISSFPYCGQLTSLDVDSVRCGDRYSHTDAYGAGRVVDSTDTSFKIENCVYLMIEKSEKFAHLDLAGGSSNKSK